jgi:hypothetical protein
MALDRELGISITPKQFEERFLALHKQLFASAEQRFDDVTTHVFAPPKGRYQVDHSCLFHDGKWYCYYVTGDMRLTDEWIRRFRAGDMEGANKHCLEPGNGVAVGPTLFDLRHVRDVFHPPQGRFDLASRGVCSLFRYGGRFGMLYDVRGENYIGMSLAWSDNLLDWELGSANPCLGAPSWAKPGSTAKDPHVMLVDGVYLIYYIIMDQRGYCTVTLASTRDWEHFDDEGAVFQSAPMLRGTMGIESPTVVRRDGLWHLFFTYGPGLWHSVSPTPRSFVASRATTWDVGTGYYFMGPFHATEVLEDRGKWYLTTDRKEETRRLNRVAGRLCYRGSYEDEKTLEEGIYLSEIVWKGDQPVLQTPRRP